MADEQSALTRVWQAVKRYAAKVWNYLKIAKMEYIVMASLFALDLISKAIVNATTGVNQTVVLIPNFLNIHNIHNYDAAFGSEWMTNALGSMGSRILFSIFAVIASVVFIFILIRNKGGNRLLRVAFAMLVAGALGNCIDRMFLGYVRDFVEFVYFGFTIAGQDSFYVFNIADAELVIGVILVLIYFIFMYRDKPEDKKAVLVDGAGGTTATDDGVEPSADAADTADGATDATDEKTSAEETSAIDRDSGGNLSDETPTEQTPTEEISDTAEIIPAAGAPTAQTREEQAAAADTERAAETSEKTNAEQLEQSTEKAEGARSKSRASSGVKKASAAKKTSGATRSTKAETATKTTSTKTVRKTTASTSAASKTTAKKTAAEKSTSGKTTAGKNMEKNRAAKPAAKTTDGENATE
jgi:signal peptidase II